MNRKRHIKKSSAKELWIVLAVVVLGSAPARANLKTEVAGNAGRKCLAYLHAPEGAEPLPLVYLQVGSGIYSTEKDDDLHSAVDYFLKEKKVAALTIDKPGIRPDESAPNGVALDDAVYNQHTQRDLVECAKNAIVWARKQAQVQENGDIYFIGHSEGSQVTARLYADLLANESSLAKSVKMLLLSGIPMNSWKDIIEYQLKDQADKDQFWKAYQNKDDAGLRKFGGIAYAYWADILGAEPLTTTFEHLADQAASGTFQFYQGLFDENTVAEPVLAFEVWNRQRKKDGKPTIRLSARYYAADHQLNLAALNDMIFVLLGYLTP